jgi:hypothetical protein
VHGIDVNDGVGLETNIVPYAFAATSNETGNVTARLTLGDGVNPSTSPNQYGFKVSLGDTQTSLSGAIADHHYIEIFLVVSDGYELNLSSMEIAGETSPGTGCTNMALMSSLDGYDAGNEIASVNHANQTGGFDTDVSGFGAPIDLSGVQYQHLTGTNTFRLYGWNSVSGAGVNYIRNLSGNDLVVNGTVAELSSDGSLSLTMAVTNGTAVVAAAFTGTASTNYVLQYCEDLAGSNGWNTVSSPFATDASWLIETTNSCGFYRAIAQ